MDRAVGRRRTPSSPSRSEQKGPKKFFRSATPGAWQRNMSHGRREPSRRSWGKTCELGYPVGDDPVDSEQISEGGRPSSPLDGPDSADTTSETEDGKPAPGPSVYGPGTARGDIVSAAIRRHGEGRDYSDLGRLLQKRGSPASRRDRKVAITFDDGPVLQTHRVLATLRRFGARATFFPRRLQDGWAPRAHQAAPERRPRGRQSLPWALRVSHDEDVAACSARIRHLGGSPPALFRPPFGAVDRPGAEAAIEDGMQVILWSVDSKDGIPPWQGISAEEITRNVLDHLAPGAIVLLHDGLPWSRAADSRRQARGHSGGGIRICDGERVARRFERPAGHRTPPGTGSTVAPPPPEAPHASSGGPRFRSTGCERLGTERGLRRNRLIGST